MSDEIGSITARLKLDASDWFAEIERAKTEAESLRSVDPTIQVKAETGKAVADLEVANAAAKRLTGNANIEVNARGAAQAIAALSAVAAAEERLRLAELAHQRAGDAASAAEDRRWRVLQSGTSSLKDRSKAEDAAARAASNADQALVRVESAERALTVTRARAAATAETLTQKSEKEAAALNKTGNAAKGAIPWMGILVGAIGAVSPGIVAVGAAAIGLSGELALLGGAGVLAFMGIHTAMAAGLPIGNQYSTVLDGLEATVTRLQLTAAQGLLPGFTQAAGQVTGSTRILTGAVALLAGQFGGMLNTSVHTVLSGLSQFAPLVVASGAALQDLLHGVDGFTNSNGFTQFIQYTVQQLPNVMGLIGSVLGTVGHLFAALAPAGGPVLSMLQSLVTLIGALAPTLGALMPTVSGIATGIGFLATVLSTVLNALGPIGPALVGTTGAFIGLSFAAKGLAPAVTAAADAEGVAALATRGLGAAVDFAMGPIGLAIIAAGLLASAIATAGTGAKDAAVGVGDLTNALQQDNGVVGANTRAMVAKALADQQVLSTGRQLGLSSKTVTDAALGNTLAYAKVTAATKAAGAATASYAAEGLRSVPQSNAMAASADRVKQAIDAQRAAIKTAVDNYNLYAQAAGHSTQSTAQLSAEAARLHMPVAEFLDAATAQQKAAAAAVQLRDGYRVAGDAANLLKLDLDNLNGVALTAAQSQNQFDSALANMAQHVNAAGKQVNRANDLITGMTAAAVANRGELLNATTAAQAAGEAYANLGHSGTEVRAKLLTMRQAIIDHAASLGMDRKEVAQFVDSLFKIPKKVESKVDLNTAAAGTALTKVTGAVRSFSQGKYIAFLEANGVPASRAVDMAKLRAMEWARQHPTAKLDADNKAAIAAAKQADQVSTAFAQKMYLAQLLANGTPAAKAIAMAKGLANDFAALHPTPKLGADPNPALSAIQQVKDRLAWLDGQTATVNVRYNVGSAPRPQGRFATGGTVGMAEGGSVQAAAQGITAFAGSVYGPGTAASDTAGLFRLANGEEVVSNMAGQASMFRRELKAINAGVVRTPADLAAYAGGGRQAEQHIHVHITGDDSILAAAMRAEVQQGINAQIQADYLTTRGGRQGVRY